MWPGCALPRRRREDSPPSGATDLDESRGSPAELRHLPSPKAQRPSFLPPGGALLRMGLPYLGSLAEVWPRDQARQRPHKCEEVTGQIDTGGEEPNLQAEESAVIQAVPASPRQVWLCRASSQRAQGWGGGLDVEDPGPHDHGRRSNQSPWEVTWPAVSPDVMRRGHLLIPHPVQS